MPRKKIESEPPREIDTFVALETALHNAYMSKGGCEHSDLDIQCEDDAARIMLEFMGDKAPVVTNLDKMFIPILPLKLMITQLNKDGWKKLPLSQLLQDIHEIYKENKEIED